VNFSFLEAIQLPIQASGIAAGSGKGRVPWTRLQETQSDFILPEYLPTGVTLTQYHHIRLEDANALLEHWTQRQAAGEISFRFRKVEKADRNGKRKSAEVGGSIGIDLSNGDSQDTREDQEQESDAGHHQDGADLEKGGPDREDGSGVRYSLFIVTANIYIVLSTGSFEIIAA
jgi:hypothetical protein